MAVLGMRGTGQFSADDRPKNYRSTIMFLNPNTEAPLTAITGQLKEEPTDDPEFKVFTKGLPDQRSALSGGHSSGTTTFIVAGGEEKKFKKGSVILVERTLEIVWVTADPSTSGQIPVARGKSGTSGTAALDTDPILVIGSCYQEGVSAPTAVSYDTAVGTNYCQIFRTAMSITETARATRMRWGTNPWPELQREGLEIHGVEMEKAFIFGGGQEDTSGTFPQRTTKGLLFWVTTNVVDYAATGVSEDAVENNLEGIFRYGSKEKAVFLGGRALNVLHKVAKRNTDFQVTDKTDTYGLNISSWQTPYGMLRLIQHPLLSDNATFRSWAFLVDMRNVVFRPLVGRDTHLRPNIQANDADARVDEYLTEAGMEFRFEQVHGIWKGMTAFAA